MKQRKQSTREFGAMPRQPDFSYNSVLTSARIERAAYIQHRVARISAWIGRKLIAPFVAMRRRNREYEELMSLDDHILADIGIARSDIPFLIKDCANQGKTGHENGTRAA